MCEQGTSQVAEGLTMWLIVPVLKWWIFVVRRSISTEIKGMQDAISSPISTTSIKVSQDL